jgi:aryl-alcohol dehydrogenase-like predicted oxidoreductase
MFEVQNKVIIGSWPMSGDLGSVSSEIIRRTIDKCVELGFTEFDTAPNYGNGNCELLLGSILKNKSANINTKFGNSALEGKDFSIEGLRKSVEQSLSRLGVDTINVLFLHNPRHEIKNYDSIIGLIDNLKKEGKINDAGISLARNHEYGNILGHFGFIQDDYNLLYQESISVKDQYKDVTFHARSPLATGILSGKLALSTTYDSNDYRVTWLKVKRLKSILKRVRILGGLSNISLHSLARRFVLYNNLIDKVIFGIKTPEHVDDIYNDLKDGPLEDSIVRKIKHLYWYDFGLINEKELSF